MKALLIRHDGFISQFYLAGDRYMISVDEFERLKVGGPEDTPKEIELKKRNFFFKALVGPYAIYEEE